MHLFGYMVEGWMSIAIKSKKQNHKINFIKNTFSAHETNDMKRYED